MLQVITWPRQDRVLGSPDLTHCIILNGTSMARFGPIPMAAYTSPSVGRDGEGGINLVESNVEFVIKKLQK